MTTEMSAPEQPVEPPQKQWEFAAAVAAVRKRTILHALVEASPRKVALNDLWRAARDELQKTFGETFNYSADVLEVDIDSLNRKLGSYGIRWYSDRVALPIPEQGALLNERLNQPENVWDAIA